MKIESNGWNSFTKQLDAIQAIRSLSNGSLSADEMSRKTKNTMFEMIAAILNQNLQNSIKSQYIQQLLLYQINNTATQIVYDWSIYSNEWRFLEQILLKNLQHRMPHILNLSQLFPRTERIVFLMPSILRVNADQWMSMICDLPKIPRIMTFVFEWETNSGEMGSQSFASLQKHHQILRTMRVKTILKLNSIEIKNTEIATAILIQETNEQVSTYPRALEIDADSQVGPLLFNHLVRPSSAPEGKCPNLCINLRICDWVSPLTKEDRVESLVFGFIRELSCDTAPDIITLLCWQYTGDHEDFDGDVLWSMKESGLNCCGYATRLCICKAEMIEGCSAVFREMIEGCSAVFCECGEDHLKMLPLLIKLMIDVAAFVVAALYAPESTISVMSIYSINAKNWLFFASIGDIPIPLIFLGFRYFFEGVMQYFGEMHMNCKCVRYFCFPLWMCMIVLPILSYLLWIIIAGFILVSLDPSQDWETFMMIILWCITQGLGGCFLCYRCCTEGLEEGLDFSFCDPFRGT